MLIKMSGLPPEIIHFPVSSRSMYTSVCNKYIEAYSGLRNKLDVGQDDSGLWTPISEKRKNPTRQEYPEFSTPKPKSKIKKQRKNPKPSRIPAPAFENQNPSFDHQSIQLNLDPEAEEKTPATDMQAYLHSLGIPVSTRDVDASLSIAESADLSAEEADLLASSLDMTESGLGQYPCQYCSKVVTRKDHLRRHLRQACPSIPAAERAALKSAVKKPSGKKSGRQKRESVPCPGCGKVLHSLWHMKRHAVTCMEYQCVMRNCGELFASLADFCFHLTSSHPNSIKTQLSFLLSIPDSSNFEPDEAEMNEVAHLNEQNTLLDHDQMTESEQDTANEQFKLDKSRESEEMLNSSQAVLSEQETSGAKDAGRIDCNHCSVSFSPSSHKNHLPQCSKLHPGNPCLCGGSLWHTESCRQAMAEPLKVDRTMKRKALIAANVSERKKRSINCIFSGCKHNFYRSEGLEKHIARMHSTEHEQALYRNSLTSNNSTCWTCAMCNDTFETLYKLKSHEGDIHNMHKLVKINTHICTHTNCNKAFPDKWKLEQHMSFMHKALACYKCQVKFKDSNSLKEHNREIHKYGCIKKDSGQSRIKHIFCPKDTCTKVFPDIWHMKRHASRMHGDMNLQLLSNMTSSELFLPCPDCRLRFPNETLLTRHYQAKHYVADT